LLHVERHKVFYSVGSVTNLCSFSSKIDFCRAPLQEFLQLTLFILRSEMQHIKSEGRMSFFGTRALNTHELIVALAHLS